MNKFNLDDYDVSNIGTIFRLKAHPSSRTTFLCKLILKDGELKVVDYGGYEIDTNEICYLESIVEHIESQKCQACAYKVTKGTKIFYDRILCDRHYNNEVTLAKISIRDFFFKIETIEEYKIFEENYSPWVHNEQDLKFPCRIVLHREVHEYCDESIYTAYIINEDMGNPI